MTTEQKATEQLSPEEALMRLPQMKATANLRLARLNRVRPIQPGAAILDVGTAQGQFLIACALQGYEVTGVEPWEAARNLATQLASHENVSVTILPGVAEAIPCPADRFDVVTMDNVLEHVLDAQAAMNEAYRVLKPGGVFWFYASSSLCPRQGEIRGFPMFGWYPDRLKRHIMEWAKNKRPHLVGHTQTPAINWFTPWKARRMLRQAGFVRVYDRWDLRLPSEGGTAYQTVLRLIRLCAVTKLIGDVLVPECSYAAIK